MNTFSHFTKFHLLAAIFAALVLAQSSTVEEVCVQDGTCTQDANSVKQNTTEEIDLGVPQNVVGDRAQEIQAVVDKSMEYVKNTVMVEPTYADVKNECKFQHKDCAFWALLGECENNPAYMQVNCAPACQTCDKLTYEGRCPLDPSVPDVWGPGDLNKMFERIISNEEFKQFEPRVVSRPEPVEEDSECSSPKSSPGRQAVEVVKETEDYNIGPWVIIFENFATPEECERLIELGAKEGYQRSSDVGEKRFDGTYTSNVNSGRTSTNSWCQHDCYEDPVAKGVMDRISNLTGIPELNSEYLQMLKYEEGQHYQTHSDYIPHQLDRQSGVRLLTLYLYLNDVEEGGETDFPKLGLTVTPKRGRAALWPSVLNEDPNQKEFRTIHQAKPVIKGVKYGANAWIHQKDFKTPNKNGCT